jgi:ribulose-5-phosphate 4-epimerase/fuculose-1-phosphate aldolase
MTTTPRDATANVTSESTSVESARIDLAAVHRIVVMENMHEGTWNHFSAKVPGHPDHLLLSPGHTHFSRVTASNLLMTDPSGTVVEGTGIPNISAWAIHQPIQQARPDVSCALHVHSPYATALASLEGWEFDARVSQQAASFHGRVAYYRYEGVVTESQEGDQMAAALGDKWVLFMHNHGVLVVGETIELAMLRLVMLEKACQIEVLARSTGHPLRLMPEDVARSVADMDRVGFGELGYLDAMKEVLDRRGEDYGV